MDETRKSWRIIRLDRRKERMIVDALPFLYDIDKTTFRPQDDPYGLKLLSLALLQPEAFWLVNVKGIYIGYLSMFVLRSDRLFKNLTVEAHNGNLEIPDLLGEYTEDLSHFNPLGNNTDAPHIYIDGLAIKRPHYLRGLLSKQEHGQVWRDLIISAWRDLESLKFHNSTVCTITVRRGIGKKISDYGICFDCIEDRPNTSLSKYRRLYAKTGVNSAADFRAIIANLSTM